MDAVPCSSGCFRRVPPANRPEDAVPVPADDFEFGREKVYQNCRPPGYTIADALDYGDWLFRTSDADGMRFDDTKGTCSFRERIHAHPDDGAKILIPAVIARYRPFQQFAPERADPYFDSCLLLRYESLLVFLQRNQPVGLLLRHQELVRFQLPSVPLSIGRFYFAQLGHFHFAPKMYLAALRNLSRTCKILATKLVYHQETRRYANRGTDQVV